MRLAAAVLAVAVSLFAAGSALACSCIAQTSAAEQLQGADVVFRGRVQSSASTPTEATTTFRVIETIKGRAGRTVRVRHARDSAACGVTFRRGSTVTVVADRDPQGALRTSLCALPRFPVEDYRRAARGEPVPAGPPPPREM